MALTDIDYQSGIERWGESMRGRVAMLAAAMVLAGCETTGQKGSELLALRAKPGTARLVIYRTSAFGLLIQPEYLVDGRKSGSSQPGAFIMCDLAPGSHAVSVANIPIALPLTSDPDNIKITLRAGTTTYLRADPQMGLVTGAITLTQVAENQGRNDTANLSRIATDCRG
jgi:hypothetical protein